MERQQVHINDQIILIKNLEDQLRVWEESEMARVSLLPFLISIIH